jgi:hypothetical protein
MEKAIYFTRIEELKNFNYQSTRIYFGNEFCQNLIPHLDEIKTVLDFILKKKLVFTFVTSYITDDKVDTLTRIFEKLITLEEKIEVVFNDWGVFYLLKNYFSSLIPVMGRLLSLQRTDPRILKQNCILSKEKLSYYQSYKMDSFYWSRFLKDQNINRIEIDNLLQGINRDNASINASLYFPYSYLNHSRYCIIASSQSSNKSLRNITDCAGECRNIPEFTLYHSEMSKKLFLKGNVIFIKNDLLPEDLSGKNIDRIVFEPKIPMG